MRSHSTSLLMVFGALFFADIGVAAEPCPGDCSGDGVILASDIGRMQSLLVRCGPCADGRPGAVAAGCTRFDGCPSSDLNGDGCFTAAEFAFILRSTVIIPPPPEPGVCLVDKTKFPPNKPKVRACDCNGDGHVGASDISRILALTNRCTKCADGSAGAPAAGCPAITGGCPAADPDGDGCIRPGDVDRICFSILH